MTRSSVVLADLQHGAASRILLATSGLSEERLDQVTKNISQRSLANFAGSAGRKAAVLQYSAKLAFDNLLDCRTNEQEAGFATPDCHDLPT